MGQAMSALEDCAKPSRRKEQPAATSAKVEAPPATLRFQANVKIRAAVEGGDQPYVYLPVAAASFPPLSPPAPFKPNDPGRVAADEHFTNLHNKLSVVTGMPIGTCLGQMQRGVPEEKAVGLHLSLNPAAHAELIRRAAEPVDAEFTPEKLCYWTTLSKWQPELKKRVNCTLQDMLVQARFRTLHTLAGPDEAESPLAETALIVLKGTLTLKFADDEVVQHGLHLSLGATWARTEDEAAATKEAEGDRELGECPPVVLDALRECIAQANSIPSGTP
eukprot:7384827-Prymnesium_polylepis.1